MRKLHDLVIYRDPAYYPAFPSLVRRPDGEILLAFRRAPNRLAWRERQNLHVDPNSYLMTLRSRSGLTWGGEPDLLHAHAFGGSQDPCLLQLRDGTLLCTGYAWAFLRPEGLAALPGPVLRHPPDAVFLGGFLLRSADGGHRWSGLPTPPAAPGEYYRDPGDRPLPAYNRGALLETRDGRLLWAVAVHDRPDSDHTSVHLLTSPDQGRTWQPGGIVATDARISFNETSLVETPGGELVAFLRTAGHGDRACLARSHDGGGHFAPWIDLGFQGHPLHALPLPDGRVLLTYGHRHPPYGIRARVLAPDCHDAACAPELVLREDGEGHDLGYPWAVTLDDQQVLVAYYFRTAGQPTCLAGTVLGPD
jgi:sialidase-1